MKEYNPSLIPLAKELRKCMTPWERKLWYDYLRFYSVRFQRQKVIGNYIADFYCAKAGLIIELDGGGHYQGVQKEQDNHRTKDLEAMNLRVIRICNADIDKKFRITKCRNLSLSQKSKIFDSSLIRGSLIKNPAANAAGFFFTS